MASSSEKGKMSGKASAVRETAQRTPPINPKFANQSPAATAAAKTRTRAAVRGGKK